MAQLIVAAAGAAIGGALAPAGFALLGMSGAQLGWMAGSMLGALANKPPGQHGPRLDDSALRVTGTEYGQCIPWVAGAPRLPGIIVWASDRRETATTEEVGKGGGQEYTTYSYDIDVLYVAADQPGCLVTRIWMNGKLVWTTLATSDDESRLASEGSGGLLRGAVAAVASSGRTERWARVTVYDGREDQLPDPTYEAAVTNAPAYRGRTTVFIEGLQLGNSGALPNFTFEVCSNAGESDDIVRRYAITDIGAANRYRYGVSAGGLGVPMIRRMLPTLAVESYAPSPDVGRRRGATIDGEFGAWPSGYTPATLGDWNGWELNLYEATTFSHPVAMIDGQAVRVQRFWHQGPTTAGTGSTILSIGSTAPGIVTGGTDLTAVLPAGKYIGAVFPCTDGVHLLICTADTNAGATGEKLSRWYMISRSAGATTLVRQGAIDTSGSGVISLGSGVYGHGSFTGYSSGAFEDDLTHVWWAYGAGDLFVTMGTIGDDGVLRLADTLKSGAGIPGSTGFSSFSATSCWAEAGYCVVVAGGTYSAFRRAGTQIREVPLRRVVEELCDRAGMPAGTYDASALDAITKPVRALAITQVSSARATLDMLMTSHAFVAALADRLYFFPRGTTVDATIAWGDLGTGEGNASDDPLALEIGGDLELPAQMAVQYRNMAADQQAGVEYCDRIISGQASVQTVQLALGMLPIEAKGVADVLQLDGMAAQLSTSVSVPLDYATLWPGSVVEVLAWDGTAYRMRVRRRDDDGVMLKLDLVGDDPSALTSQQVTDSDYTVVTTVRSLDGTAFEVLDIPILRDADDSLGYYVATKSQASGRWPGAVVQASRDGVSFSTVATVSEAAVFGSAVTALQAWAGGAVMDEVSHVDVTVGAGQLSSVTREQLLADGALNAVLVGSEIIRFVSAQLLSTGPNVYRLTRLLRGQRGTEWANAGHSIGERVVMLRARGLRRVASDASDLAVTQQLRAATLGTVASDAAAEPFTLAGVGAKPFSPTNLRAASTDSGAILLTWERRSRRSLVMRDGIGISLPLGESAEAYAVDVYDAGDVLIESQTITGATSATLGAPVLLRTWPRDAADLIEYGGYIYARNTLGSGGVQRYDSARTLLAELANVTGYGDSTTKVERMVHDGAGTAYLLLSFQITPSGGLLALKVLKLDLSSLTVTGACDVYAAVPAAYTRLHYYSGAVYVAGPDGSGGVVLARVDPGAMTVSASITIAGGFSSAIADDGAGNICMVEAGEYRRYDASTLAAASPVVLGVSMYADELRLVGGVLWACRTAASGGAAAINAASGALIQSHPFLRIAQAAVAVVGASVVMQEERVVAGPSSTSYTPGDLLQFNAATGALTSRIPFNGRYFTGITASSNYVANVRGSGGVYAASEYGAPGVMAGGRAVVHQISATVGRGYPAEIDL